MKALVSVLCLAVGFSLSAVAGPGSETAAVRQLTLDEAVQIALRQNPQIEKSRQEIERTRGVVIEVRAQALPRVSSTATYTQQDPALLEGSFGGGGAGAASSEFSGEGVENSEQMEIETASAADVQLDEANGASAEQRGPERAAVAQNRDQQAQQGGGSLQDKSWRVAFEVRQVIYAGGQVRAAMKIARLTEDTAYYQLRDTIDRVIAQVRTEFYTVILNRRLIDVQQESVALLRDQLADQQARLEAGTVPRFNVLRAEVELANQAPLLIRARNEYQVAQLRLAKTLGIDYDRTRPGKPPIDVAGSLAEPSPRIGLAPALATAAARRPFLKIQRQQMLIDVQRIQVALAGYKPRVDVSAGYEFRNSRLAEDLAETVNGWFFGVTGRWDIFDGFETHGQVKQAKARLESSRVNYEDSIRQVEFEVQQAWLRLEEARETIESQQKNVEQAAEALRLAGERLEAGAGTQLDVLDARVALTRARVTVLQAQFDYNTALAEFERVTATATEYPETFADPMATRARARAVKKR